jgi:hypothetical protein
METWAFTLLSRGKTFLFNAIHESTKFCEYGFSHFWMPHVLNDASSWAHYTDANKV